MTFTCPACGGAGTVSVEDDVPSIGGRYRCPPCRGTGRLTFKGYLLVRWTLFKMVLKRMAR